MKKRTATGDGRQEIAGLPLLVTLISESFFLSTISTMIKASGIISILASLLLLAGCSKTSPEFKQQWAVAGPYLRVGDYKSAAAALRMNLNDPLERAIFQRIIAQNIPVQDRIKARIYGWSEDNSDPLPYPYMDREGLYCWR